MPTNRQRKLAQVIVENAALDKPLNKGEMLVKAGYDETTAVATPTRIIEAEGVKEALAELGFNPETAMTVVADILTNEKVAPKDRLRAASEVFKVHGSYAAEKHISANVNIDATVPPQELAELKERYEAELKAKLLQ